MILALIAIASLIVFLVLNPLNRILFWLAAGLVFLPDHLILIEVGDLIPAVTFSRIFILAVLIADPAIRHGDIFKDIFEQRRLQILMAIFAAVFICEIYGVYRPKDGTRNLISFSESFLIPFFLFFLARYYCSSARFVNKVFVSLVLVGSVVSLMGVYEQVSGTDLIPFVPDRYISESVQGLRKTETYVRSNGPYMTPETYGLLLSITWVVILFMIKTAKLRKPRGQLGKATLLAVLSVVTIGVFCCMFRSVWLGLIGGLIVYEWWPRGKSIKNKWGTFIAGFAVASMIILGGVSPDVMSNRVLHQESMYSRYGAWQIAWMFFTDNPFFGIGYNRFRYEAQHSVDVRDFAYKDTWAADSPHNMFLSIMAENGIVGFIPFLLLMGTIVKQSITRIRIARDPIGKEWSVAMLAVLFVYFLPWLFETTGYYGTVNNLVFLLLGITTRVKDWSGELRRD